MLTPIYTIILHALILSVSDLNRIACFSKNKNRSEEREVSLVFKRHQGVMMTLRFLPPRLTDLQQLLQMCITIRKGDVYWPRAKQEPCQLWCFGCFPFLSFLTDRSKRLNMQPEGIHASKESWKFAQKQLHGVWTSKLQIYFTMILT